MFTAIALICGIPADLAGPTVVNGCALAYMKSPFHTEEQCQFGLTYLVGQVQAELPQGVFIADAVAEFGAGRFCGGRCRLGEPAPFA